MDELKACPFCGSSNTTLDYYEISCPQELGTIVVCNDCGASAKSIVDWNTRPIEDALRAQLAARDEQIAELTATTHSQAVRNAELLRFVWWVYQVYARNVQELTSGITEACTYETEEKAEKGKYGLPIRCWEYIRYLEEYTAGIYNGTYLDSETSTGVKDPPAGHWKSHVEPKELE